MKRYSIVRLSALNFCSEHQYDWNLSLRWNKPTFQLRPWYQSKLGWTTFSYSPSTGSFIVLVIFRVAIDHLFSKNLFREWTLLYDWPLITLDATDVRLGRHVLFYLSSLRSRGKKIENDSSWFAKTAICQNDFITCSRNHLLISKKSFTTSTDCNSKSVTNSTHVFEQEINKC